MGLLLSLRPENVSAASANAQKKESWIATVKDTFPSRTVMSDGILPETAFTMAMIFT